MFPPAADPDPAGNDPGSPTVTAFPVVGIGASAGGLEALREMLSVARRPTGLSFAVVQHLDPTQDSLLAELLDRATTLDVVQVEDGDKLRADTVHIIPPGYGLTVRGGVLKLTEFAQPRGLRRPIDDFFLSLAEDQGVNAACVILSGTGSDGTTGLRAIKEHGGVCLVQDPDTAKYDGMPLSAISTGLVDFVAASGEMLPQLKTFFERQSRENPDEEDHFVHQIDDLCAVLRTTVGHDFSGYKRSTFIRRVERRMHVLGITSGRAYLDRIRADQGECIALFRDLLINVTRFFRDSAYFDRLRTLVIEPLVAGSEPDDELRFWVAGCSSGEEAYSVAMLVEEAQRVAGKRCAVQIFATDIDEQMLQIAREGTYPLGVLADIPPELRQDYTILHADRFTIATSLRSMIRFSNHSLVKDPPFLRLDLVTCRNLLIYFDEYLQQKVLPLLHYALRPDGHAFLGPSESVGRFERLFTPVDQQARIFRRIPGAPLYPLSLPSGPPASTTPRSRREARTATPSREQDAMAVRRVIDRYAPPSMVLDPEGTILSAYGRLSRFFDFPVTRTGGTSAIGLARPGLREVLGPLLRQGCESRQRVIARAIDVTTDYGVQRIDVICDPLQEGQLLFVF